MRAVALCISAALAACGYGGTACKIIDSAHDACTVIRYLGPDGKMHELKVSPSEINEIGLRLEQKRQVAP